jgi:hypothetical protein
MLLLDEIRSEPIYETKKWLIDVSTPEWRKKKID